MSKPLYDIDTLLEEVVTLPSLPSTVYHITQLTSDPACPLGHVAKAISTDPALALKTLRLVNSAYYGLGQKIATIEYAVVLLGLKVINNLVITAAVFDTLKGGIETYLKHSVGCAVAMRNMAETCGKRVGVESPEEAFVYGLLHDVGKVVFEQFLPNEFAQVVARVQNDKIPWHIAEREIIGPDHAQVGARIAEKWKLPERVVHAISGHHDLAQCEREEVRGISAMLSVADFICTAAAMPSHSVSIVTLSDEIWAEAKLTSRDMPVVLNTFFDASGAIEELLNLARK